MSQALELRDKKISRQVFDDLLDIEEELSGAGMVIQVFGLV